MFCIANGFACHMLERLRCHGCPEQVDLHVYVVYA